METTTCSSSSEGDLVCQTCGDKGFTNAFIYCVKCLGFVIHRYCLDVIPKTFDEFVPWFCEDCNPSVPYQLSLPKLDPSGSQKDNATTSKSVKKTNGKKKQKKKTKVVPLLALKDVVSCQEEAIEPLKEASVKSDSGCNESTPPVVSQLEKGVFQKQVSESSELDNNPSPPENSPKRKRNPTSSVKSDSGCNQIMPPVVSELEKGVSQKPVLESSELDNNPSPPKRSPRKKRNATSSVKSDSGCNQITPPVVSELEKGVFQKQVSESSELDNNPSPPKRSPRKKRNATSSVKSDSGCNQITPLVFSELEKGVSQKQVSECSELDNNPSPSKKSPKRKRNATSSVKSDSGGNEIKPPVVSELEKGVFQKQVLESFELDNNLSPPKRSPKKKRSPNKKRNASSSEKSDSGCNEIMPPVVSELEKGVFQKQVSESFELDNNPSPPKKSPKKKRNGTSSEKSDSGCNEITPAVVSELEKGVPQKQVSESFELDNNPSPPKKSPKKKRNATSSEKSDSGCNEITPPVVSELEKGVPQKQVSESFELDNNPSPPKKSPKKKRNATSSEKSDSGCNEITPPVVSELEKGVPQKQVSESFELDNNPSPPKKSPKKKRNATSSEKSDSGCNEITPPVVSELEKGVSQKQVSESFELDNNPSPQKKGPKKKRNATSSVKSDSGCNPITPPVVSELEKGVSPKQVPESSELDNNPSPPKRSPRKKRNPTSSVKSDSGCSLITPPVVSQLEKGDFQKQASESAHLEKATPLTVETEEDKTREMDHSVEPSVCDSSCTNLTSKDKEEERSEIQQSQIDDEKLVSEFSSIGLTKKSKDYDGQIETANQTQTKQETSGADAYMSALVEYNEQYIHYPPARPVLDPVWRGSFNITKTDYPLFEGFVGHLSTKACYRVCEEASTLPSLLSLDLQPKTALWPKSFLESQPSDEHIALYFFPGDIKNERAFERLVIDMIDEELAMRATAKNAELLIFTSTVLPQSHWRFQGNYYLWGVFRAKLNDSASHVNQDLAVSNNSVDHYVSGNSLNEVTSGEKIHASVKHFDSRSPQSPLCNYRLPMAQNNTEKQNTLLSIKLNNMNFIEWYRALRIVLRAENKLYVLDQPIPEELNTNAPSMERDAFKNHEKDACEVSCLMLTSMEPELQKQFENMLPFDMIGYLKLLFQEQVRHERCGISKKLLGCKLAEGSPVEPHVLEMIGYIKQLKELGFSIANGLAIDYVLQSLPSSYNEFVMNYKMQDLESSLRVLLNMLQTFEQQLSRSKLTIPMVPFDKRMKGKGKFIAKSSSIALRPNGAIKKKPKSNIPMVGECFHCNKPGHYRRTCSLYLKEKKRRRLV